MSQTRANNLRVTYAKFLEAHFGGPATFPKVEQPVRKDEANNDVVHDSLKCAIKCLCIFLLNN
jgi:hypothetical protein